MKLKCNATELLEIGHTPTVGEHVQLVAVLAVCLSQHLLQRAGLLVSQTSHKSVQGWCGSGTCARLLSLWYNNITCFNCWGQSQMFLLAYSQPSPRLQTRCRLTLTL